MKTKRTKKPKAEEAIAIVKPDGKLVPFKYDPIKALSEPTILLSELITGGFASSAELPIIAGRLIQATLKGKVLQQFGKELKELREKGKIKEDYFTSNDGSASLNDLLEFFDTKSPDLERFKAFKSIFLTEICTDTLDSDRNIAHELLKKCLLLESMDILILKTCFQIINSGEKDWYTKTTSHGDWVKIIAKKLNIRYEELISLQDDKLVNLGLLTPRTYGDKSGINPSAHLRLTGLGLALCDYVSRYP